ncbi:YezD family protein [Novosphingobium sp.]|uniref:YezD family protein n=1 Tax=Novosphingobium sp. TaxID=1874826 RepID=UPI002732F0DE|nr:YezD family protein [Novosphingobium sp.]MDP3908008.1 YezD family protein [Novosphingobium sp.]
MEHPVLPPAANRNSPPGRIPESVLDAVSRAVGKLRFGVVQLTVHEGRVVQLDVTERQRFG